MSMTGVEVMQQVSTFFNSFNFLSFGLVIVFVIAMIFLARSTTKRKDEFILALVSILTFGGLFFFASDPFNFIILLVVALIVVFGLFRKLWTRNREVS